MKLVVILCLLLYSSISFAECNWSDKSPIRNLSKVKFEYCESENRIKLSGNVELEPNILIQLLFPDCPECNMIWAKESPDRNIIFVYVENREFQRNGWIIDLNKELPVLFIDDSTPKGKHYSPKFLDSTRLQITHAGMGYKKVLLYSKSSGEWKSEITE